MVEFVDVVDWAKEDFHDEEEEEEEKEGPGNEHMEVRRGTRRGFSALIAVKVYGTEGFGRR